AGGGVGAAGGGGCGGRWALDWWPCWLGGGEGAGGQARQGARSGGGAVGRGGRGRGGSSPSAWVRVPGKSWAHAVGQRSDGEASAGCGGGGTPQPAVPFSIGAPARTQGPGGVRPTAPRSPSNMLTLPCRAIPLGQEDR